jgi:peptide/nickel transport system permease protein
MILDPRMTEERKRELRELWGLPPKEATFLDWVNYFAKSYINTITFRFGYSFMTLRPVMEEIAVRLPNTLILMGVSFIIAVSLGIWQGVKGGANVGSKRDTFLVTTSLFIYALPIFWLGMVFILIFAYYLGLFPVMGGTTSIPPPTDPVMKIIDYGWHLLLPATTLAISSFGSWYLLVRNSVVNVFTEDYIMTARAKGLDPKTILYGHALRNALLPTISVMALSIAWIWTGAVLTETVFSWFGMGRYFVMSVLNHDWPASEALFYLIALSVVIANFIADVLYAIVDPRVRY